MVLRVQVDATTAAGDDTGNVNSTVLPNFEGSERREEPARLYMEPRTAVTAAFPPTLDHVTAWSERLMYDPA